MDCYVLAHQFRHNLLSLRMGMIFLTSLLLIGVQYWTTNHASYVILDSAPNFLRDVMLFSQYGTGSGLYLFLLPFLAALAGSGVISEERHSARLWELTVRDGRSQFSRTSMVSGWISGAVGGALPLVLNLCWAAACNPHLEFIDGTEISAEGIALNRYVLISSMSWIYPVYRCNQVLCIVLVVAMVAVISGLYAALGVGISFFVRRRYVELIIPFVVSLVWWMMPALTGGLVPDQWSPVIFLSVGPGTDGGWLRQQNVVGLTLTIALLTVSAIILLMVEERRDER